MYGLGVCPPATTSTVTIGPICNTATGEVGCADLHEEGIDRERGENDERNRQHKRGREGHPGDEPFLKEQLPHGTCRLEHQHESDECHPEEAAHSTDRAYRP